MRLFLYLSICFLFLSSCNKETRVSNPDVLECAQDEDILEYFQNLKDSDTYILSIEEDQDYYTFIPSQEQSIKIEKPCIQVRKIEDKSKCTISFENNQFEFDYRARINVVYKHNPFGKTPLSGSIRIESSLAGRLQLGIKPKAPDTSLLVHQFKELSDELLLPVLGLYYNFDNQIYVQFEIDGQSYYTDTISVAIAQRPSYLPNTIVDVYKPLKMEPGMHFISYRARVPSSPFILDNYGEIRYHLDFTNDEELADLNYDVGMERLANGNYYFGKWPSNQLYEIDVLGNIVNQWNLGNFEFHHNVQEKQDGNFLCTVSAFDMHSSGRIAIEDWIVELDRQSGSIINTWNLKQSLDDSREVFGFAYWGNNVDWAHANAVIHDPADNTIIVSLRTQCVVKLDYQNNVKWILSNHKSWGKNARGENLQQFLLQPLDKEGQPINDPELLEGEASHPDFEWPWYQHAPLINSKGNLMVFDNGENRDWRHGAKYSRAVEYEINEDELTVKQIWQYGKERGIDCYSRIVSDVDVLEQTGNIYFCPGSRVVNGGGNFGAKIIELDYDTREVVFEMRINAPDIVFHRAEKLSLYPASY